MNQSHHFQEDHELNYVHEQLKLNIVLDVLNYNGPISIQLSPDEDLKLDKGISASLISSVY